MYADNTLTPKEAIRLCALGILTAGPMPYGELAGEVRHFISRIQGPSLEMMGTSIELLKYEALVETSEEGKADDDALLTITEKGQAELHTLLTTNIRAAATEMNKLIIALKFRFLHLLDGDEQKTQVDHLIEVCENEITRLDDLRQHHGSRTGFLPSWLDHDISQLESNMIWLKSFHKNL